MHGATVKITLDGERIQLPYFIRGWAHSYPSIAINNRGKHGVRECLCDSAVNVVCNFMIGGLVNRNSL